MNRDKPQCYSDSAEPTLKPVHKPNTTCNAVNVPFNYSNTGKHRRHNGKTSSFVLTTNSSRRPLY